MKKASRQKVIKKKSKKKMTNDFECHKKTTKKDCTDRCQWKVEKSKYGFQEKCRSRLFEKIQISFPPKKDDFQKVEKLYVFLNNKTKLKENEAKDLEVLNSMLEDINKGNENLKRYTIKETEIIIGLMEELKEAQDNNNSVKVAEVKELIKEEKKTMMSDLKAILIQPLMNQMVWFGLSVIIAKYSADWLKQMLEIFVKLIESKAKYEFEKTNRTKAEAEKLYWYTRILENQGIQTLIYLFTLKVGFLEWARSIVVYNIPSLFSFFRK